MPPVQNYLIITNLPHPRADVSCALKMIQWVHTQLKISFEQIVLAVNLPEAFDKREHSFKVISTDQITEINEIVIKIFVPVSRLETYKSDLDTKSPSCFLYEYGYSQECPPDDLEKKLFYKSFGLSETELGIFVQEDLKKANFPYPKSKLERDAHLEAGFTSLFEKISKNPFLLYFGYTHSQDSLSDYILAIAMLSQEIKKPSEHSNPELPNLVFIFPGLDSPFKIKDETFQSKLISFGIGNFSIFDYAENYDKFILKTSQIFSTLLKRNIFFIYGSFNPEKISLLWSTSERETIVEADHSLGGALSSNKRFVYINPMLQGSASLQSKYSEKVIFDYDILAYECSLEKAILLYKTFLESKIDEYRSFSEISNEILKKHNCSIHLQNYINAILFPAPPIFNKTDS